MRLVGDRHDPETDTVTIVTDRCPLRQQNYDYAQYLLTALFHESWTVEEWEATKSEADAETYEWAINKSKQSAEAILNWGGDSSATPRPASSDFAGSVETMINDGENEYNLSKYKDEVLKLLSLPARS